MLVLALALAPGCKGRLSGGGGGTTATFDPPVLPPLTAAEPLTAPTLVSAVPDADRIAVSWRSQDDALVLSLFIGSDATTLYDGAPAIDPLSGSSAIVTGLTVDTTYVVGLAVVTPGGHQPTGTPLTVVTRTPIYVDVAADPVGANGKSPATAYPNLISGLIDGLIQGGVNLWIAGGIYPPSALPVFPNIGLYGGFASDFDLTTRDPVQMPTVLPGPPSKVVVSTNGAGMVILDGLVIDGQGAAKAGVQAIGAPIEVRGTTILNCNGPGLRLRANFFGEPVPMTLVDCQSIGHSAEGFSIIGTIDLTARGCRFESNVQEGADFKDITANVFKNVTVRFNDCRFAGNGTDGVDLTMGAPILGGPAGDYRIYIENCIFEQNGTTGLLLDIDFAQNSGGRARLELRGLVSRANRQYGVHLDLDSTATIIIDSLVSTANAADGLLISSDVVPVVATVSHSVISGNLGAGVRTTAGQASVLLSHVLLAGNGDGGVRVESATVGAVSSLAWLQPSPWVGVSTHHVVTADDPLLPVLGRLPVLYDQVVAWDDATPETLTLATVPDASLALEVDADSITRLVTDTPTPSDVAVDPAPLLVIAPASLTAFPDSSDVAEDYRALPGGAADDAGMAPPGGLPLDVGPLPDTTAQLPGTLPLNAPLPFHLARVVPALGTTLLSSDTLTLSFEGGLPDAATVGDTSIVVRDGLGTIQASVALEQDGEVLVSPPASGWSPGALRLELHELLSSLTGQPLSAPLMLPFEVSP